ncbi:hypothetical protein [Aquimarina sp. 2201CG5-10]|uniref:hypothetical protein n=1 Tax=Aquimarina callyspongiae TaxID=3098150 RepID=UPI002AB33DAF|nr:hypothetical protein [Aquimarina sp. 2201CG5-10]MDY8134084.1 hypothetical protein [Aquimarina sp. 2201CG5-10]
MTIEDLNKEITTIKKKIDTKEKKDSWDKIKIITSILIPLAIAYAGHEFSSTQQKAEIHSNETIANLQNQLAEKQFEYQKEISSINSKVGQVGLVSEFFEALLSKEPVRKKLAIKAVLIVLKDEGPGLVKIVEESDEAEEIKSFAMSTLNSKRDELAHSLFSESKAERINAYNDITAGWKDDSKMAWEILKAGNADLANKNGVYNALVTLSSLDNKALEPYIEEIKEFSAKAEPNGEKTKGAAQKLRAELPENNL